MQSICKFILSLTRGCENDLAGLEFRKNVYSRISNFCLIKVASSHRLGMARYPVEQIATVENMNLAGDH